MNRLWIIGVFIVMGLSGFGQSKPKLEARKEQNQKDIEYTNNLLKNVQNKKNKSISGLKIIEKSIKNSVELINICKEEADTYTQSIETNQKSIENLNKKLEKIKETYAKIIVSSYYNNTQYDRWMYILSSEDFSQAYNRYKYFQQFSDYANSQITEIRNIQDSVSNKIVALREMKEAKEEVAHTKEQEKEKLDKQKKDKEQYINGLKKREKELLAKIKEQKKQAQKLEQQIQALIAKSTSKPKTPKGKPAAKLSAQDLKLGKSFNSNRGKLPWPTSSGFISSKFGKHAHPILKHVKIDNNGIDITTQKGSSCKAIFEGEVSQITAIPGLNTVVILRHGEYLSVYANLVNLDVKTGSKLKTGQKLGTVATSKTDGSTILQLQIWKNNTRLNPALWLNKK